MNPIRAAVALSLYGLMMLSALPVHAQPRGELLYDTHCKACHTEQVHWRDNRLATDWFSLVAQVRRWQEAGSLGWADDDIVDVARFLNANIYRYPEAPGTLTRR